MRRGRMFRSGRTRPADGQSNNSEILSRIQSLADYTIDTLESSFRKRHPLDDVWSALDLSAPLTKDECAGSDVAEIGEPGPRGLAHLERVSAADRPRFEQRPQ